MTKNYQNINLVLGSTVAEAVETLLYHRKKGRLVSVEFNGVTLYSDNVTMDSAYMQITGMTKDQFDDLYGAHRP